MSLRYDVVVVGGGPAGAAAAIRCAMNGFQAALIEADSEPAASPFESLHPGIEPLLRGLGIEGLAQLAVGRYAAIAAGGRAIPLGRTGPEPWQGFHVARGSFDAALRRRAATLGVTLVQGSRVRDVEREGGRVTGVVLESGACVRGRWIVDASGHRRVIARKLALRESLRSAPLIAWRGEVESHGPGADPQFEAEPDGWNWSATLDSGRTVWTVLRLRTRKFPGLPPRLARARMLLPPKGRDVTWRLARPAAGAGYLLAGEAAASFDPACGQGVFFALTSGLACAETILQVCRTPAREGLCLARFDDWIVQRSEEIGRDLREYYEELGIDMAAAALV